MTAPMAAAPGEPPAATGQGKEETWQTLAAKDPRATALCKEIFPCAVENADDPPYMCALAGVRNAPPEHGAGLTIESLSCPFRRLGMGAMVGIPDDGTRPLLQGDALHERVRALPRLRAMTSGAGRLDERTCPVTESGGTLRFCIDGVAFKERYRCLASALDSTACAQELPERLLAACQALHPGQRVHAEERYWGPGWCAVPSDHVRDGEILGRVPSEPGTSQRGESAKMVLRAGGREVRILSCGVHGGPSADAFLVDGDPGVVAEAALLPRLDSDAMRATLLAGHVDGGEWAVLLDPIGGEGAAWPAKSTCRPPPGPRRIGRRLEFLMTPSIANRARVACTADLDARAGTCTPVAPGTYCE